MSILPSLIPNPCRDPAPVRSRLLALLLAAALIVVACALAALRLWGQTPERDAAEHAAMVERLTREAEASRWDAERGESIGAAEVRGG